MGEWVRCLLLKVASSSTLLPVINLLTSLFCLLTAAGGVRAAIPIPLPSPTSSDGPTTELAALLLNSAARIIRGDALGHY